MTEPNDAVIVAATRTPIGRSGRALAGLTLIDIGMQTVAGVLASVDLDPADIDDIVLGEALQGGGDTARYIANALGLPPDTPGGATQRQCATGMMAVQDAAANIRAGMADVVVAGGIETMTRFPALYQKSPLPFGEMQRFSPPSHPDTPDAPNTTASTPHDTLPDTRPDTLPGPPRTVSACYAAGTGSVPARRASHDSLVALGALFCARNPISASARSTPRWKRSSGDFTRHFMTMAASAGGVRESTISGATGVSCTCLYPTEYESAPSNGGIPSNISYSITPTAYRSLRPSTIRPIACSGDM